MSKLKILLSAALLLASSNLLADKTTGDHIDDSVIQSQVKAKLMGEDFFGGTAINTEIHKGIVQLGGWIDMAENGEKAAAIAASVEGVVEVDNQLHEKRGKATAGQSVDDGIMTTRVITAISKVDFGKGLKTNVTTYNGVVLLTGFADGEEDKTMAGELAAGVDNVEDVVNGIYVLD